LTFVPYIKAFSLLTLKLLPVPQHISEVPHELHAGYAALIALIDYMLQSCTIIAPEYVNAANIIAVKRFFDVSALLREKFLDCRVTANAFEFLAHQRPERFRLTASACGTSTYLPGTSCVSPVAAFRTAVTHEHRYCRNIFYAVPREYASPAR
jgi:hypothetical protein